MPFAAKYFFILKSCAMRKPFFDGMESYIFQPRLSPKKWEGTNELVLHANKKAKHFQISFAQSWDTLRLHQRLENTCVYTLQNDLLWRKCGNHKSCWIHILYISCIYCWECSAQSSLNALVEVAHLSPGVVPAVGGAWQPASTNWIDHGVPMMEEHIVCSWSH